MVGNGVIRYTKRGEEKIYELTPEEKKFSRIKFSYAGSLCCWRASRTWSYSK